MRESWGCELSLLFVTLLGVKIDLFNIPRAGDGKKWR